MEIVDVAPGPDAIGYRLLEFIGETTSGRRERPWPRRRTSTGGDEFVSEVVVYVALERLRRVKPENVCAES